MRLIDADAMKADLLTVDPQYETMIAWCITVLDAQPTIEPEPRWISCSERLPEESGLYIVTNVGRWVEPVGTRYYNIRADGGFWSGHPSDKVLAWMPLPKPYGGEQDG